MSRWSQVANSCLTLPLSLWRIGQGELTANRAVPINKAVPIICSSCWSIFAMLGDGLWIGKGVDFAIATGLVRRGVGN